MRRCFYCDDNKILGLQVDLAFDFGITVAGKLTFTSFIYIYEQLKFTVMQVVNISNIKLFMSLILSVSCGMAFVEWMVPNS